MVHRAAFEVPPVGEDLLAELAAQEREALVAPLVGLASGEVGAGEDERLRVREEVVPEDVPLEVRPDVAGLAREALDRRLVQPAREAPADPVHDAQRRRVCVPARAPRGVDLVEPARDERVVPGAAVHGALGAHVVEVVGVVAPERTAGRIVPVRAGAEVSGLAEHRDPRGTGQHGCAARRGRQRRDALAHGRRRRAIHGRPGEGAARAAEELCGTQVAQRPRVEQRLRDLHAAAASSSPASSTAAPRCAARWSAMRSAARPSP